MTYQPRKTKTRKPRVHKPKKDIEKDFCYRCDGNCMFSEEMDGFFTTTYENHIPVSILEFLRYNTNHRLHKNLFDSVVKVAYIATNYYTAKDNESIELMFASIRGNGIVNVLASDTIKKLLEFIHNIHMYQTRMIPRDKEIFHHMLEELASKLTIAGDIEDIVNRSI